jgi:hypothetical protein
LTEYLAPGNGELSASDKDFVCGCTRRHLHHPAVRFLSIHIRRHNARIHRGRLLTVDFNFVLLGFIGAVWLFFLKLISDVGTNNPASSVLMVLAFIHYVVFIYLLIALVSFYQRGMLSVSGDAKKASPSRAEEFLIATWPVTLLALALGFLYFQSVNSVSGTGFILSFVAVFIIAAIAISWWTKGALHRYILIANLPLYPLVFFAIGVVPYMLVMSLAMANLQVKCDKEFYESGDEAKCEVVVGGYVFLPYIQEISSTWSSENLKPNALGSRMIVRLKVEKTQSPGYDFLLVRYAPQFPAISRVEAASIRIVPSASGK